MDIAICPEMLHAINWLSKTVEIRQNYESVPTFFAAICVYQLVTTFDELLHSSVLASIRAVDYYIFGRKDIRKELLNGEDENENGSSFWKLFSSSSSSKPSGKSAHHQANAKPQFWKAQMFHVVGSFETLGSHFFLHQ